MLRPLKTLGGITNAIFEDLLQLFRDVMSTHASILVDSVGPPSAEVCRTAASFP